MALSILPRHNQPNPGSPSPRSTALGAQSSSGGTAVKDPTLVAGVAGVRLPLLKPDAAEFE